ncbi:MAG: ABC transporter permease [Bifidobacteriaceae bacterium]|jgi:osmoprotectant transport system permease protein|nr:ABC transporter permease [Bifidobacteriaceae bacterium]
MLWLSHAWPQVFHLLGLHLALSLPAILASILIAVPLGRLSFRAPRAGGLVLTLAGLLYAIPSLPLLIVIPAIFGVPLRSGATIVIALTAYGVALLVRTAADAFRAVDPDVRRAAVAVGFSRRALLWRVDLPLAVPVIAAGVRVVAVSTVGLVTIGSLVGIDSLGTLFTDGFQRGIVWEVATGLILTVLLALALDAVVRLIARALTPWARPRRTSGGSPADGGRPAGDGTAGDDGAPGGPASSTVISVSDAAPSSGKGGVR